MELTVLKDETVKDMDLPLKLLSWPGSGPPAELSALPRLREQCSLPGNASKMVSLYTFLSEMLC